MLLLAILLLLGAVGLLLAAVVTGQNTLAWGSVGVSAALAVVLLILSRRSGRRRREAAQAAQAAADAALDDELDAAAQPRPHPPDASSASPEEPTASKTPADPLLGVHDVGNSDAGNSDAENSDAGHGDTETDAGAFDDSEPDEEDTDAADLLVIWELADEVLVVDEHPRYHLARCDWPDAEQTERLPLREARELGFTPCAQCRPDAALARRSRAVLAREDAQRTDESALNGGKEPAHNDKGAARPGDNGTAHAGEDAADTDQQPVAAGGSRTAGDSSSEATAAETGKHV